MSEKNPLFPNIPEEDSGKSKAELSAEAVRKMGEESREASGVEQDIFDIPKGEEAKKNSVSDSFRNFKGSSEEEIGDGKDIFFNEENNGSGSEAELRVDSSLDGKELFPNLSEDTEQVQKEVNVAQVKLGNAIAANKAARGVNYDAKEEVLTKKDIYNDASELIDDVSEAEISEHVDESIVEMRNLAPGIPEHELGTEAELEPGTELDLPQEINLPKDVAAAQELNLPLEGDKISLAEMGTEANISLEGDKYTVEEMGTELELPLSGEAQVKVDKAVEVGSEKLGQNEEDGPSPDTGLPDPTPLNGEISDIDSVL